MLDKCEVSWSLTLALYDGFYILNNLRFAISQTLFTYACSILVFYSFTYLCRIDPSGIHGDIQ